MYIPRTAEAAETTAPEAQQPEDAGETGETDGPDYGPLYFVYGDCTFGILDEAGWVLNALGEPFDTMVADSCAYQGSDCYYFYDGIELCVNDVDGTERITGITLADDTVKNPQGLHIGMAVDDALAAMDMEYANADGVYSFTYGPAQLRLRADSEGTVAAISYVPAE